MKLQKWRLTQAKTLDWLGRKLGFTGTNPSRSAQRIETGLARPDADVVVKITQITNGAVTAQDMHETRLEWLAAQREPARIASTEKQVARGAKGPSQDCDQNNEAAE